ncbi:sugar phosphate isomerase/epimerase [Candidatus Woesearchaeota archaeon]|nr:sugar phosphate isomerase/epimerase [Candidatus Woesearchaeota archaeon]MBT5215589.1 sugar phosphate isomerase/epimerase [Candidatus Woesearchaeota archaeon]
MKFDTDYWSSLNRKERETVKLNPAELGYSLGGDPLKNLKAGIFMGTNNMELTFFNAPGKSQKSQGGSPEAWTKTERQEMKELARVNEVDVTIHATPNMGGGGASFSGFTGQGFSDEARAKAVEEMERTAEFAADVAGGGPVVCHIDGFQRPVYNAGGEDNQFESYKEEKEKAPLIFVDQKTGRLQQISREDKVFLPVSIKDSQGNRTDEYEIDQDTGYFKVEEKNIDDMQEVYNQLSEQDQRKFKNPLNLFFNEIRKSQTEESIARRHEYMTSVNNITKESDKYKRLLHEYQQTKGKEHSEKLARDLLTQELIPKNPQTQEPDFEELKKLRESPEAFLNERIENLEQNKKIFQTGVIGYSKQLEQQEQETASFVEVSKYGVKKEAQTIAESAMRAYEIEKKRKLKKSLWIAPENWAVEHYGSHPEEYRKIITESREQMADSLKKQNASLSNNKAKEIAEDHIRGTFDIGHLNMWKKFYKAKPGEDKDKGFAKWMDKNVRGLVKDKIIGHVHLADNFGYHDEHIELGEGNAPIQEFFKILKEENYKGKTIAEPGGQRDGQLHRVWRSAMMAGGSPIYRIDAASKSWTDVSGSYFGRTQSPNFVVGGYAPSKDDWTMWSEVPME